jgi:hypothetical protein
MCTEKKKRIWQMQNCGFPQHSQTLKPHYINLICLQVQLEQGPLLPFLLECEPNQSRPLQEVRNCCSTSKSRILHLPGANIHRHPHIPHKTSHRTSHALNPSSYKQQHLSQSNLCLCSVLNVLLLPNGCWPVLQLSCAAVGPIHLGNPWKQEVSMAIIS